MHVSETPVVTHWAIHELGYLMYVLLKNNIQQSLDG